MAVLLEADRSHSCLLGTCALWRQFFIDNLLDGGLLSEVLHRAVRHGIPLDLVRAMIESHLGGHSWDNLWIDRQN